MACLRQNCMGAAILLSLSVLGCGGQTAAKSAPDPGKEAASAAQQLPTGDLSQKPK